MTYLTVKDLKQTRELWQRLSDEREIVITKDGKPRAIMVEVDSDTCDDTLAEIRRSLLNAAVSRVRKRAAGEAIASDDVDALIAESREARGLCR